MGADDQNTANDEVLTVEKALEAAREKSVFSGHPASEDTEEPAEQADESGEQQDAEEQTDEAEQEPAEKEEPEEPEKKFRLKYASHEEAEKGAKEAERRMHEAIEEAKRMRQEVEEIRKQIAQGVKAGEVTKEEKAELDEAFKQMLGSIKELDADSPDYDATLARIWAKTIGTVTETTAKKLLEEENARRAAEAQRVSQEEQQRKFIEKTAIERAKKAGFDMDSEESPDKELFWNLAASSVGETLDDRINWTIERVNKIKKSLIGKTLSSQKQAQQAQIKNKVLERGVSSTRQAQDDDDRPITITEALARTERRI